MDNVEVETLIRILRARNHCLNVLQEVAKAFIAKFPVESGTYPDSAALIEFEHDREVALKRADQLNRQIEKQAQGPNGAMAQLGRVSDPTLFNQLKSLAEEGDVLLSELKILDEMIMNLLALGAERVGQEIKKARRERNIISKFRSQVKSSGGLDKKL